MSNPPAPGPSQPGTVSDPDAPNPFGPDAPNVRDDDPKPTPQPGEGIPEAPPPTPPATPLEDDDFAPDEG